MDSTAAPDRIATGRWMPSTFTAQTTLFGIGITFRSNHPEALSRALSIFPQEDPTGSPADQLVHIVLVADEAHVPGIDLLKRSGRSLEVVDQGIATMADGERGTGSCIFPPAVVSGESFTNAINTVVLFLVAQAGRTPLHASAFIVHERALVLAGRSGAGKSALALAADRAGLPVLAEDTVFLQLRPSFCVWGRPDVVHLSETDAPVGAAGRIRIRSGRVKRAIPIVHRRLKAERATLFLLTPGEGVIFRRLDPEDAIRELTRNPEPGYDFYGKRLEVAVRGLAAGGSWQMTLSKDPDEAVAALVREFSNVAASDAAGR